ncbi:hypothetical protein F5Y04DRAFT_292316 [Hypomontagnella monticulosa]|nr:hypothetical protein F5Y04DRAFT_292316 [Hypomontagnella monticulosa]
MQWRWNFDISSLIIYLGGSSDTTLRQARKRLPDVLSLAPVSGLQNYVYDYSTLFNAQDREYISPYGRKKAPLRNIRAAEMISRCGLLEKNTFTICDAANPPPQRRAEASRLPWLLTVFSWLTFALLATVSICSWDSTWVGTSNLFALAIWSFYLRAVDALMYAAEKTRPSFPDKFDAAIFLGPQNSAFVIEGCRRDVVQWTSAGLGYRRMTGTEDTFVSNLGIIARAGTMLLLTFIFLTIPSGSIEDKAVFFIYNILGQLNTKISLRLHAQRTLLDLQDFEKITVPTPKYLFAELLRRYHEDNWYDVVGLLPKGKVWDEWKFRVVEEDTDPEELWKKCAKEQNSGSYSVP